jgi:MHS family alpha-ketoglutarate permease-like MFS transporter
VILLLARVLQGLSVGGEYGASATYMSEMAGKTRRGFWSSFHYVTLIAGQLLALGVLIILQRTLSEASLASGAGASRSRSAPCWPSWCSGSAEGWTKASRSSPRRKLARPSARPRRPGPASPAADRRQRRDRRHARRQRQIAQIRGALFLVAFFISLIVPLVRLHPRESLLIMGLTAGGSLTFYVYTTYMQKFLVNTAGFSKGAASEISAPA